MASNLVPNRACPECGAPVVERMNGASGDSFWGCSTWPKCRWTQEIPADEWMRRQGASPLPGFD